MRRIRAYIFLLLIGVAFDAFSQTIGEPLYSRLNTFSVAAEYSNDSSHILIGEAEQRRLLNFSADYGRRLFVNRFMNWQYLAEIRPFILESDPVTVETATVTSPPPVATYTSQEVPISACHPASSSYSKVIDGVTYSETIVDTC